MPREAFGVGVRVGSVVGVGLGVGVEAVENLGRELGREESQASMRTGPRISVAPTMLTPASPKSVTPVSRARRDLRRLAACVMVLLLPGPSLIGSGGAASSPSAAGPLKGGDPTDSGIVVEPIWSLKR